MTSTRSPRKRIATSTRRLVSLSLDRRVSPTPDEIGVIFFRAHKCLLHEESCPSEVLRAAGEVYSLGNTLLGVYERMVSGSETGV